MYTHTEVWGWAHKTQKKENGGKKIRPAVTPRTSSSKHKVYFKQRCVLTTLKRDSEKLTPGFIIKFLEK